MMKFESFSVVFFICIISISTVTTEDFNSVIADVPQSILRDCETYADSCKTYGDNCDKVCTIRCISDLLPESLHGGANFLNQIGSCDRGKEKCLNPIGSDCSFYSDCLAKQFPSCYETSTDDSQFAYSKSACEVYQKNYSKLTSRGQLWIKAVRRCLQRNLAKTIAYNMHDMPCSELNDLAISQRVRCYNESNIVESVCDLPTTDVWKLFWTIKDSFPSSFSGTNYRIWRAVESCSMRKSKDYKETITNSIRHVVLTVRTVSKLRRKRDESEQIHAATGTLVDDLVDIAKFDKKYINWFAFGGPDPSTNNIVVNIFFADPTVIFDGNFTPSYEFQYAVKRFHRAVIIGKQFSDAKSGSTFQVMKQLNFCDNVFCR